MGESKRLTVGDIRRVIEGLADDSPVLLAEELDDSVEETIAAEIVEVSAEDARVLRVSLRLYDLAADDDLDDEDDEDSPDD